MPGLSAVGAQRPADGFGVEPKLLTEDDRQAQGAFLLICVDEVLAADVRVLREQLAEEPHGGFSSCAVEQSSYHDQRGPGFAGECYGRFAFVP